MMPDPAVRTYTDLTTIIDAATGEGGGSRDRTDRLGT